MHCKTKNTTLCYNKYKNVFNFIKYNILTKYKRNEDRRRSKILNLIKQNFDLANELVNIIYLRGIERL